MIGHSLMGCRRLLHRTCEALVAAAVAAAAGCAAVTTHTDAPPSAGPDELKAAAGWVRITPLSSIWTGFRVPDENFSNLYTRILINSRGTRSQGAQDTTKAPDSNPGDTRAPGYDFKTEPYEYRDRGPILRALWGTHYSINLTAYVTVGAYKATVPLVTIDHVSTRTDGEKFQRVVAHTVQNFPLMLIKGDGSNAIATLRVVVKATDQTESSVAAAAIQAAEGVAKAIAPESSVVTTLSAQSSRDKANALDSAINTLMSRQLDEEQLVDNDVRRWGQGGRVKFRIPPPNSETTWGKSDDFATVGVWEILFEDPRPSIFADVQLCHSAADEPKKAEIAYCRPTVAEAAEQAQRDAASRPEQVLAYALVNGTQSLGSVSSYLKQQAWWESSMKTFNALPKGTAPKADDVSGFCRSIKDTIATIGLNAIDGGIVVAAVRDRAQLASEVIAAMNTNPDCKYATIP